MRQFVLLAISLGFALQAFAQNDTVINNNKFIFTSNVAIEDTLGVVVKSVAKFTVEQENKNIDYYSLFSELHPRLLEDVSDAGEIKEILGDYADIQAENNRLDSINGGDFYNKAAGAARIDFDFSKTNWAQYVFMPVKTYLNRGETLKEQIEFSYVYGNTVRYVDVELKGFLKKVVETDFGKVELKLFGQHYTATHIQTGNVLFDYKSEVELKVK